MTWWELRLPHLCPNHVQVLGARAWSLPEMLLCAWAVRARMHKPKLVGLAACPAPHAHHGGRLCIVCG